MNKEQLAEAFNASRYGYKPITSEAIVDVKEYPDGKVDFQAWHDCYVDWFRATLTADGQPDAPSILKLYTGF